MAIVPRPGISQVRPSGPTAFRNPEEESNNIRRAAGAVSGALSQVGGDLYRKQQAQASLEAKVEKDKYDAALRITKNQNSQRDASLMETFKQTSQNADPGEVVSLMDDLYEIRDEEFEESLKGLTEIDRIEQRAKYDEEKRANYNTAQVTAAKRLYEIDVASATQVLEFNVLSEDPKAQEKVKEATDTLRLHFRSDEAFNTKMNEIMSVATYNKIIEMSKVAVGMDEIQETVDYYESQKGVLHGGQEIAINASLVAANTRRLSTLNKLDKAATDGELTPEMIKEAESQGIAEPGYLDSLMVKQAEAEKTIKFKEAFPIYRDVNWREFVQPKIEALFDDTDGDIKITLKNWDKVNKIIEDSNENPRIVAWAKRQALSMYVNAINELDRPPGWQFWKSDYAGDKIASLPEEVQDSAKQAYITAQGGLTAEYIERNNIDISKEATKLEDAITRLYTKDKVTAEDLAKIDSDYQKSVASRVVKTTLEQKTPVQVAPTEQEAAIIKRFKAREIDEATARKELEKLQ